MRTVVIIQARMTSTRLPGKVLKSVMGKTLLEYQIERLRRVKSVNEIVVATTTNHIDLAIVELCDKLKVACFRGSEEDVLSRFWHAACVYNADVIVRITSDCPLIDPKLVNEAVHFYQVNVDHFDYISNALEESYPRGMDVEVFSFKVLSEAYKQATMQADREHVTPFIYRNVERYRIKNILSSRDYSQFRLTVDTIEDFTLIALLLEKLYPINPNFTMEDIIDILENNMKWVGINAHIKQKEYGQ